MIQVYVTDIRNLADPLRCPELMEKLPKERREKILQYKKEQSRKQSLAAGLLLRHVLRIHGKTDAQITFGKHGKPEVEGIFFNISHSQELVVCAVGNGRVGCDVEKIKPCKETVGKRFFTEKEITWLKEQDEGQRQEAFFRLWTLKESYAKMLGEGLSMDMKQVEFSAETGKICVRGKESEIHLKEYELPGYRLAVCGEEEIAAELIYETI